MNSISTDDLKKYNCNIVGMYKGYKYLINKSDKTYTIIIDEEYDIKITNKTTNKSMKYIKDRIFEQIDCFI